MTKERRQCRFASQPVASLTTSSHLLVVHTSEGVGDDLGRVLLGRGEYEGGRSGVNRKTSSEKGARERRKDVPCTGT